MSNNQIIDEIKSHLTNDKEVDVPYLQTELAIYKQMNNEEVIYAIANMLFQYLDPSIKEKLDLKTHEVLDERRSEYETVIDLIENKEYEKAKNILIKLVSIFDKATYIKEQNYYDFDQMIEYYIFCETLINARKLKVKRFPEPVTYYMYQLSEIYLSENNIDLAIESLKKALVFNPRCQYVLQTLAKLYLDTNQDELAIKTINDSLRYAYTKQQLSYGYLLLKEYYEKNDSDNNKLIECLSNLTNNLELTIDKRELLEKYNIQFGPSPLVINAINDFLEYTKKLNDLESIYYLLNIGYELTDDETYQQQIPEIEQKLEERTRWKENQKF